MNTVSLMNDSILNSDTNKRLYTGKEEENNVFINTMSINNQQKNLENDRIITRYKNLNPQIDINVLRNCL
ncbi:11514_t:CDS:2, partial [Racocetra persica]